ncbi:uncharacterized protein LOC125537789 isoform X2 [Triticum urartu]|uniref:uncharacterized protein isoform X3 n=1 Tax=Triticum aestivum TaxID=4565 RepID=UPI001D02DE1A|nr:uncharacterized protein LOC123103006 isoform X3 [Triticum aestivum]XP_048529119.1 uncharacterized protein LOC125508448 isoform X2 [Triticum urartu]XP_048557055.1 uncharacterized protein LOC125537789 isoform X2 [Triticum urartu]
MTLAITFSKMTIFTGITSLYGSILQFVRPASLVRGWVIVSFFTWFIGVVMLGISPSLSDHSENQTYQYERLNARNENKEVAFFDDEDTKPAESVDVKEEDGYRCWTTTREERSGIESCYCSL